MHCLAANELAAVGANVDSTLKGKRKIVGGVLIEHFWDQGVGTGLGQRYGRP